MDQSDPMLALAREKIAALDSGAPPYVADPDMRLATDLRRPHMRHGVSPDAWCVVASISNECLDATRQAVGRPQLAWERSADLARPTASIGTTWPLL